MDFLCAEPDGAHLCLFIKAESERENGPFQGHPTSDCFFVLFDFLFFSWVQAAVGGIAK